MAILVVDDSPDIQQLLTTILRNAHYQEVVTVSSAAEAYQTLGLDGEVVDNSRFNLILLDIKMPDINGIEVLKTIRFRPELVDLPVIMVTAVTELDYLEKAFLAGAVDYITKPIRRIELLARIGSVLKMKEEMDTRKERERELEALTRLLEEANEELKRQVSVDGLTGIANRRYFDESLSREWRRGRRDLFPLSVLLLDIDYFKNYNDTYGHQAGDDCLKRLAHAMKEAIKRPGDVVARYGGEEFVVLLPETDCDGAYLLAERLQKEIRQLKIPHVKSKVSDYVTVSIGVATEIPGEIREEKELVKAADEALYRAKREGRNQTQISC